MGLEMYLKVLRLEMVEMLNRRAFQAYGMFRLLCVVSGGWSLFYIGQVLVSADPTSGLQEKKTGAPCRTVGGGVVVGGLVGADRS